MFDWFYSFFHFSSMISRRIFEFQVLMFALPIASFYFILFCLLHFEMCHNCTKILIYPILTQCLLNSMENIATLKPFLSGKKSNLRHLWNPSICNKVLIQVMDICVSWLDFVRVPFKTPKNLINVVDQIPHQQTKSNPGLRMQITADPIQIGCHIWGGGSFTCFWG
jgi:hypothetical protein